MIELKPEKYNKFSCPECSSKNIDVISEVFQGIHILADCICHSCGFEFYHDFPIGHALHYPIAIGKNNQKVYDKNNIKWFSKNLKDSLLSKNKQKIEIEKKFYFIKKNVIILNCMDYLYGHVLLKLFNAQYYIDNYKDCGLVIIIPKSFEWLVPKGISEAWIIDINLKEARKWYTELEEFVKNEFEKYNKIYLSLAFSHPNPSRINIERFTKVKRFNIDYFYKNNLNITFITRNDRIWINSKLILFFYKLFRKLHILRYFYKYFVCYQNKLINRTCKKITMELPDAKFNVVGLGKIGNFKKCINDFREKSITRKTEIKWCKIYSNSHIVIGVHGSNMILPTALAAGFVEILPLNRYSNIIQDIFLPYKDRKLIYFGRFLEEFSTTEDIKNHIVSIIKNYSNFKRNMEDNYLEHKIYSDLSKFNIDK